MLTPMEIEKVWKQVGEQTCETCKELNKDCKKAIPMQMFYVVKALHTGEDGEGEKDLKLTQIDFIKAIINCIKKTEYYSSDQRIYSIDALQSLIDGFELLKSYDPSSSMEDRLVLKEKIGSTVKFGGFVLPSELEWYLAFWFNPARLVNITPKSEDERLIVFKHELRKELEAIKDLNVRSSLFKQKWIFEKYVEDYRSSKPVDISMAHDKRIQELNTLISASHDVIKLGYDYGIKGNYNERANISNILDYKRFAFGINLSEIMGFLLSEKKLIKTVAIEKIEVSDLDFIKSDHQLVFTPSDNVDGFFTVNKDGVSRKYTMQKYFDLELINWEEVIDDCVMKRDKLKAARNAMFHFKKNYLNYNHPGISSLKDKTINHLGHIIEHIETTYNEAVPNNVNVSSNSSIDSNESSLPKRVEQAFAFMGRRDLRTHKDILSESDFSNLIAWVTYYFQHNFELPEINSSIRSVNTAKGNVVFAFKKFFTEEHPSSTRPDSLYELIRACFYDYRNDKISNLKKTKEPQYFSELVKKSR